MALLFFANRNHTQNKTWTHTQKKNKNKNDTNEQNNMLCVWHKHGLDLVIGFLDLKKRIL